MLTMSIRRYVPVIAVLAVVAVLFLGLWWSDFSRLLLLRGMQLEQQGELQKSLVLYDSASAIPFFSSHDLALFRAGRLQYSLGQFIEARDLFLQVRNDTPLLVLYMSRTSQRLGEYQESADYLALIQNVPEYAGLFVEERAMLAYRRQEYSEAIVLFNESLQHDSSRVRSGYYSALLGFSHNPAEALELFQKVLKHVPESELFDAEGPESITEERRLLLFSQLLQRLGEGDLAMHYINLSLDENEEYRDAYVVREQLLREAGKDDAAKIDHLRVIELDPDYYLVK